MARKLVCVLSLAAVIGFAAGCKEDSNTTMKFDPNKSQYGQQQQQYKGGGAGTNTTAATTTTP
jgi:hypothetical protein